MTPIHLLLVLLLGAHSAYPATTPCLGPPDRLPEWACILCGPNTDQCLPYNATFDDLPVDKPVGRYNDVTWSGFVVANAHTSGNAHQLTPLSKPNFARLPAGSQGVMQTNGGELLYDFHYGCTTPGRLSTAARSVAPTPCTVLLTANCSYSRASAQPQQWKFNFNATCERQTKLAGYDKSRGYVGPGYGACASFIWSASSLKGEPVDLYLDEVIYKRVPYW